jgi:hypothetical protein
VRSATLSRAQCKSVYPENRWSRDRSSSSLRWQHLRTISDAFLLPFVSRACHKVGVPAREARYHVRVDFPLV